MLWYFGDGEGRKSLWTVRQVRNGRGIQWPHKFDRPREPLALMSRAAGAIPSLCGSWGDVVSVVRGSIELWH